VDPVKDHETLLAAFAQARNAGADIRLMLVGEGTERAAGRLQRLSAD
jgi:glycosyltransferase involved in cell wall biosynthesis